MNTDLLEYTKTNDEQVLQSKTFARIAKLYDLPNKRVLDIGCGVGSHMQRFGAGSIGLTTNPDEVVVGQKINRDIRLGNVEKLSAALPQTEQFDVIWCNNIFEHLLSPHAFLVYLKQVAHADTVLVLGTPMVPTVPSLMRLRQFRGALATPHVNFFNYKTYELSVTFAGWTVQTLSSFYFRIPLLNYLVKPIWPHLYLVAKNDPTYRYHEKKLKEWKDDPLYDDMIAIMNPK